MINTDNTDKYIVALNRLTYLRSNIKNDRKSKNPSNNAPIVCSDESLEEMARKLPTRIDDFKSIKGLGDTFVENYGEQFLVLTKELRNGINAVQEKQLTKKEIELLKKLSSRLVAINKRNKMLYLSSLKKKDSLDLFQELNINQLNNLVNGVGVKICPRIKNNEPNESYKVATSIYRETNRILREKGQNKLYLSFCYLIGKAQGEDFNYRAPLVFIPVILLNNSEDFKIELDTDRDVIINSHLIIANNKFNKLSTNIDDNSISEPKNLNDILNQAKEKFSSNNINLKFDINRDITKFENFSSDNFPHFKNGEMKVEPNLVLGLFSVFSNSIAFDFNEILNNGMINNLTRNLILEMDNSANENGFSGYFEEVERIKVKENDIVYINELNSSQEKVLKALYNKEALVIEGPPGTGKSQTITSLITHSIYAGKNILLVSEKKAALDVVHSRLGDLGKNSILIDDLNNKTSFYDQLRIILSQNRIENSPKSLSEMNRKIDSSMMHLDDIANILYAQNEFGLEIYKCYAAKKHFKFPSDGDKLPYNIIEGKIPKPLLNLKYSKVKELEEIISNNSNSDNIISFTEKLINFPWLINLNSDLNNEDIYFFLEYVNIQKRKIDNIKLKFPKFSFLLSLPSILKLSKKIDKILKYKPKKWIRDIYKSPDIFNVAFSDSFELLKDYAVFSDLSPVSKDYILFIVELCQTTGLDVYQVNNKLFNYYLFKQVQYFERRNSNVLSSIDNFEKIIKSIEAEVNIKKNLTKKMISSSLSDSIYSHLITSKHADTLNAKVNSKRRWSVNKFINTFQFELFNGIRIWLMTPEVVSDLFPLVIGLIDVVIFDEASQMYIERGIPAIIRSKQVIIAGDSKQLRPSKLGSGRFDDNDIEENDESEIVLDEESLLDVAKAKYYPPVPLTFHYRSQFQELINFSNYAFYGARLNVSPNITVLDNPPIEYLKVEGKWINKRNVVEAKKVAELIKNLLDTRKNNESIGVVTFNSTQRDEVLDQLDELMRNDTEFAVKFRAEENRRENGEDTGIFVKNIENVQGDERDIIIFSIAYGKNANGRVAVNFGWLSNEGGENRLNVAITRAKKKVYIIASLSGVDLDVSNAKHVGPKIFKKYLLYSEAISDKNHKIAKEILESFGDTSDNSQVEFDSGFEEEVFDALREKGLEVDTQVGVGGYRIDLAIKYKGNYILGVECDGKLYHSSKDARERDYHRQKYLESRGWRIHRIWSTNWWQNPDKEIDKILENLKKGNLLY